MHFRTAQGADISHMFIGYPLLTQFPHLEADHFHVFLKCRSCCDFTFTALTAKAISIYTYPGSLTSPLCPWLFKIARMGELKLLET